LIFSLLFYFFGLDVGRTGNWTSSVAARTVMTPSSIKAMGGNATILKFFPEKEQKYFRVQPA
jgi:hypothetical protein